MDVLTEQEREAKREYQRAWREKNREKLRAAERRRYAENPEFFRNKSQEWRKSNPEKISEYVKATYAVNKEAENARNAEYREKNKEKISARRAAFRLVHGERLNAASRLWKLENIHRSRAAASAWQKNNPVLVAINSARRRAARLKATPVWADSFIISEFYDLAARRSKATGIEWHVDHIIPLRSELVCGLHCESNLRLITAIENSAKGNRHWPDMP